MGISTRSHGMRGTGRGVAPAALFCLTLAAAVWGPSAPAAATCLPVAEAPGGEIATVALRGFAPLPVRSWLRRAQADAGPPPGQGTVALTFLGHSSFLIRTPGNVAAVTDFNGYVRPGLLPDIVTMNHAHSSHYTDYVDPRVRHVLRGWSGEHGFPRYDVTLRDMRVRNVPTNIRDGGGTEIAGNSIFIFETTGLCIAHLGHLHHPLTPELVGRIGQVDVLLVPIDDGYTMRQDLMAGAVRDIKPRVVVPMHYFGQALVDSFLTLMEAQGYEGRMIDGPSVALSKGALPRRRTVMVLQPETY